MFAKINLKNLPEEPGCYVFSNKNNTVIYVGKANNLKKRVSSYFNKAHDSKTALLVREIEQVKTFITTNPKEALILEQNLIKKHKPRYNVLLNDDKRYPYIVVTNEKDPQYKYIRKYNPKNWRTYGPLPIGSSAGEILKMCERLFPLRRCSGNLGKPCLHYYINQCSGACFKNVSKEYYKNQIKHLDKFFSGNITEVKKILQKKMQIASDNLQFEEANRTKKIIESLSFTSSKQVVELSDEKNRDVIAYTIENDVINIEILFYLGGKFLSKDFIQANLGLASEIEALNSFLNQIYSKNKLPKTILVSPLLTLTNIDETFKKIVKHPKKMFEQKMLDLAQANLNEDLRVSHLNLAHRQNNSDDVLDELQALLNLDHRPSHIEMFDIANILDEFVTGAVVVFKNGQPSLNDFRKYNIDIEHKDDYHRLQNVVYRRYQKMLIHPEQLPNLIIMDGGIIQVHAAKRILQQLELTIPVIGLVKNNKHRTESLLDLNENKLKLQKATPLYNFLVKVQDRVHLYAISSFRNRQAKSLITSHLEHVKGLGPKNIQKINASFSSIEELKQTTLENILKIIKNKTTANNLYEYIEQLNKKGSS